MTTGELRIALRNRGSIHTRSLGARRRPGGVWGISFGRMGIRSRIPSGAQYGKGALSQETFFRNLREKFAARWLINDVPLGIAWLILRIRASAKLFTGRTNARAVSISGNDFEELLRGWIARIEGPTVLRDASVRDGIPERERTGGRRGADAKRQPTVANLAKQVRRVDAQLVKKVAMDPFRT